MYCITRQAYWPEGNLVVEIVSGGIDFTNPDALVEKYEGEFKEFTDPREAVKVAISIFEKWRADEPGEEISIAYGNTGGYTMPFEPFEIEDVKSWGEGEYKSLPKCSRCGGIIRDNEAIVISESPEEKYCSEYCADKSWQEMYG